MPKTERWQWYVEEFAPSEQHHHAIEELFVATRSEYQQVAVLRSPVFGKMLVLDGDTQSSQADERIYHEALVHPALAAAEDRSDVLIVGGGEGATLREALRCPDVRRCTMVDIDGLVVELARKYLAEWSAGAFDDARANVVVGDALEYLRSHDERYGTIVSDLTEPLEDSPSNPLFNDDVFALIKSHVLDGGVYVLQASTAAVHNASLHCKMARTLRRHYRHVASFSTHVPAFDTEWAFLACSDRVDVARLDRARSAE
ncbi:MAG: spermidine synthase [Candidatus Eremiobacteraeota bacterium]|nr:spermidine synthase [Candidatus Eremiobacteraeota bacterium]